MVRELKHTEIGDIPIDWELQTFEETFSVLSSNTLSRENLNNCGGAVRNIHYGDILTKFPEILDCEEAEIPYINDLSLLTSSAQLLQDGDIVIADTAEDETVGKVTEVINLGTGKLVAGLHTIPCRVKKGDFVPGWLGYYMNSHMYHNQIIPFITGIKVASISKSTIANTWIVIPPRDEQKRIVEILSQIDLLIQKEQEVTDKITAVKKGCLSKMFPIEGENIPEMRFPGFEEEWEKYKFEDLYKVTSGYAFKYEDYCDKGISLINGEAIQHGKIEGSNINYLPEAFLKEYNNFLLKENDIVLGLNRPITNGNLKISKISRKFNDSLLYQRAGKVNYRINIDVDFTFVLLSQEILKHTIKEAVGSDQPFISTTKLDKWKMLLPREEEEQKAIGEYFANLDHLIILHQQKCEKYKKIKSGLISMLIR